MHAETLVVTSAVVCLCVAVVCLDSVFLFVFLRIMAGTGRTRSTRKLRSWIVDQVRARVCVCETQCADDVKEEKSPEENVNLVKLFNAIPHECIFLQLALMIWDVSALI